MKKHCFKRITATITTILLIAALTACGQKTETVSPVEEVSDVKENEDSPVEIEEEITEEASKPSEETDPCEANGHTWVDATCTEPKTCSVCGETEGEPLDHKWLENTPNLQQPKTCEICGATEGEPLEAKHEGMRFVEADTETDMNMILDGNPDKTNVAKVWFDNYKIFDSDETHEAKEGYEWRTVDMHLAIGDDTEFKKYNYHEANAFGEYYQDNAPENDQKNITVNYLGEDYVCDHVFTVLNEEKDVSNPDYKKYGWSGEGTSTFEYNEAFLVPKGFDGIFVCFLDLSEYELKDGDFDALENMVSFRLD